MYSPCFILNSAIVNLVAEIVSLTERFAMRMEREDTVLLRRANRIKSVHSSLAIEGNTLSESQISDILDGRPVIGPKREVEEAANALAAYGHYSSFDPLSISDLLRAHGMMMANLLPDAGRLRGHGVGVVSGSAVLHVAPQPSMVPELLDGLFAWVKDAPDHMLVRSSVFHYDFEFIHPFSDGNGRMGRFWQSLLLASWNPVFAQLPIENLVRRRQAEYYKAINDSTAANNSGIFVEFMLGAIDNTLREHARDDTANDTINDTVKIVTDYISANPSATYEQIAAGTGRSRSTVHRIIRTLKREGRVRRIGASKNGRWEVSL